MLCKTWLIINITFGFLLTSIAAEARPIYMPFAFVDIRILQGNSDHLFDKLTEILRRKATLDVNDNFTKAVVQSFGEKNPERLILQYVEKDGAKISLGQSRFPVQDVKHSSPYVPDVPYIIFFLGYGQETMPEATIAAKVAELVKDAEEGCDETATQCSITHRLALPTKF